MKKNKSKLIEHTPVCEHVWAYECSTPKGDIYVCTLCGKRVNEKDLPKTK